MAKTKKVPRRVVNVEQLSDELKALYKKIYDEYQQKNILALRDEARRLNVESPTTLGKDDLVKRLTDFVIYDYLPKEMREPPAVTTQARFDSKERVHGLFDYVNGEYRVGDVMVPDVVVREAHLMIGDMVEGAVTIVSGAKTLFGVNSIEDDAPNPMRRVFNEMVFADKRPFKQYIENTKADELFPDLTMGERIIMPNMSMECADDLYKSFQYSIGLFLGVAPELRSNIDKGLFYVPFDMTHHESIHIARLALERAKRLCERGKNVALVVYGFDSLEDRDIERALFGSGRCFENGSITVFADIDKNRDDYGIYTKYASRIL